MSHHPSWGLVSQSSGSRVRPGLIQVPPRATLGGFNEVVKGLVQLHEQSCGRGYLSDVVGSARLGTIVSISQGSAPR